MITKADLKHGEKVYFRTRKGEGLFTIRFRDGNYYLSNEVLSILITEDILKNLFKM